MSLAVYHERCGGLDVHKQTVVATVLTPDGQTTPTFATTTEALLELGDWLAAAGVTHVAMERTGVSWKPVSNRLELRDLTVLVVNAQQVKALAGRKTDLNDATWLAALVQHGLLHGSLIPSRAQRARRARRELVRYRTSLVQARPAEVNRIHALLEGANRKLRPVSADITGVSGRAVLEALAAGEPDPAALAARGEGRLRARRAAREAALSGTMGAPPRLVLPSQLGHFDGLTEQLAVRSAEIPTRLAPHSDTLARLDTIPGVGLTTAELIVAELGTDLTRFPSAAPAASWAGLAPGQHESGGTRRRAPTRTGSRYLRAGLAEAARAAGRRRQTALGQQYQRLALRLGPNKAATAIARKILILAYILMRDGGIYHDPLPLELPPRVQARRRRRALQDLRALGDDVTLTPVGAAP